VPTTDHSRFGVRGRFGSRHKARRGFFILFGSRALFSNDMGPPVRTVCPRCGREADLLARNYRQWFTLFFIPIFPISGNTRFSECSNCHARFQVPAEELRARLQVGQQQQNQQAIALYNSLRASPANSVTLNELMQIYATMKEFDQAISAAGQFPQALHNSEQCMTTLGRIYLARNQFPEALQWFDSAIERNPQLGEAQYHKAVTHLLTTPPELGRAITAARAARSAGYPNADALLREAESKARGADGGVTR